MKNFIKVAIITLAIAGLIIMLTSCQKENCIHPESEYKGTTYFRVESVSKSGETDYSTIERVEIK